MRLNFFVLHSTVSGFAMLSLLAPLQAETLDNLINELESQLMPLERDTLKDSKTIRSDSTVLAKDTSTAIFKSLEEELNQVANQLDALETKIVENQLAIDLSKSKKAAVQVSLEIPPQTKLKNFNIFFNNSQLINLTSLSTNETKTTIPIYSGPLVPGDYSLTIQALIRPKDDVFSSPLNLHLSESIHIPKEDKNLNWNLMLEHQSNTYKLAKSVHKNQNL